MVIFFILGYHHLDTRTAVNRGAMRKEQSVKKSQGFLFSAKVRQLIHIFFLETRTITKETKVTDAILTF